MTGGLVGATPAVGDAAQEEAGQVALAIVHAALVGLRERHLGLDRAPLVEQELAEAQARLLQPGVEGEGVPEPLLRGLARARGVRVAVPQVHLLREGGAHATGHELDFRVERRDQARLLRERTSRGREADGEGRGGQGHVVVAAIDPLPDLEAAHDSDPGDERRGRARRSQSGRLPSRRGRRVARPFEQRDRSVQVGLRLRPAQGHEQEQARLRVHQDGRLDRAEVDVVGFERDRAEVIGPSAKGRDRRLDLGAPPLADLALRRVALRGAVPVGDDQVVREVVLRPDAGRLGGDEQPGQECGHREVMERRCRASSRAARARRP